MAERCMCELSQDGLCTAMEGNKVCGAYVLDREVVVGSCLENADETSVTFFPTDEL